jgi:hypothetical protein
MEHHLTNISAGVESGIRKLNITTFKDFPIPSSNGTMIKRNGD